MSREDILDLLMNNKISKDEALHMLDKTGYEEMGFAKLDCDRERRTGFQEVVFCQSKADDHLVEIYKKLYEMHGCVFGTRASNHQYELRAHGADEQLDSVYTVNRSRNSCRPRRNRRNYTDRRCG